jgi:hypothetical protein
MAIDARPAASAVTAAVCVRSRPVSPRITGFTKMM